MVERNPIYVSEATADSIDYKPLSLLAVAAFTLAVLYTVGVLVYGLAAFLKGEPLLLDYMSLAIPVVAALLSCLALWQIQSSEGTRAGGWLAKWALGLSLVVGLGYITYETFTGLAIVQQANRFLLEKGEYSGFFPRLQEGDAEVRTAFLFLLGDLAERGTRTNDPREMDRFDLPVGQNPKGPLTQFLESALVRAFVAAAPGSVQVEPLAVRSWTFEGGAYSVTRLYRITTDEAVFELPIGVASIEPRAEGEKRRWRVDHQTILVPLQPLRRTPLGEQRLALRQKSVQFLADPETGWLANLRFRRGLETYLGTLPPAQRQGVRDKVTAMRADANASAPRSEDELLTQQLPGYRSLNKAADYFKLDAIRLRDIKVLPDVVATTREALSFNRLPWLDIKVVPNDMAPCEFKAGEVLITHQAEMVINLPYQKGEAGVLLLLKIVTAAPEKGDPTVAQWRIQSAEVVRALGIPPKKQS